MNFKPVIFLVAVLSILINSYAQQIDTLISLKSIKPANVTVNNLDVFFDSNQQLVAYSNVSGTNESDTLVIYDFKQDAVIQKIKGTSWDYNLQFIHDNRLLYLNLDDTIRSISNFNEPLEKVIYIKPKHTSWLSDFSVSKDKSILATLASYDKNDNTQVIWFNYSVLSDTIAVVDSAYIDGIDLEADMVISDNNKYIVLNGGYEKDFVVIVDMETREVHVINTSPNGGTYSPVIFRQDDKLKVAVGGGYINGKIEIIDVETMSLEKSIPAFWHYIYAIAVDSSGQYLACGGFDGQLRIYDITDLAFDTVFTADAGCIEKILFCPDKKHILVGQGYADTQARLDIYEIIYSSPSTTIGQTELDDFVIYPVPVHDKLFLENTRGITHFSLYSANGELIKNEPVTDSELDFTGLPPATYLIKFYNKDREVSSRKIIRQ
jgi:WD40 repeat protein